MGGGSHVTVQRFGRGRCMAAFLLSACIVLAAACSGAGGGGSGGSGPIHLAMIGPLTGTYAENGAPILAGTKAAVKVINDGGGVLGHKVVMDQVDTVGD